MILRLQIFLLLLLLSQIVVAQKSTSSLSDSLSLKSFEELNQGAMAIHQDSSQTLLYAKAWLKKSKLKNDYTQMSYAYKNLIYKYDKSLRIAYTDSMVTAAKMTNDVDLLGAAYMTKGIVHFDLKEQTHAQCH